MNIESLLKGIVPMNICDCDDDERSAFNIKEKDAYDRGYLCALKIISNELEVKIMNLEKMLNAGKS